MVCDEADEAGVAGARGGAGFTTGTGGGWYGVDSAGEC